MNSKVFKNVIVLALALVLPVFYAPRLSADEESTAAAAVINMLAGDIQTVPVNKLNRVSVTNPEIADISDAQNNKVSLLAKKAGETVLFLWDADGERNIKVRVVNEDLDAVKAQVQKLLQEAGLTGLTLEENEDIGKVVISGRLSKQDKGRMDSVLQSEADNIVNFVQEENSQDLIQVDMQIVEISTSLEKNLGILWGQGSASTDSTGTSTTTTNTGQVALGYGENLPSGDKFKDLFKIGNFQRTTPLQATVNALLQEGKARLISKPRLVVMSGKQASFLVGGEIPIETTTSNTTGSTLTQNVTYTQYGVNLTLTPTLRQGKIDVLLNVDIRDIDPSNSSNGNVAFITRTAQTDLYMDNKQTIALAGLIKYADSEQVTKVPFLSNIPVLGALFRNRSTPSPDANTEMVIILTPTILSDKKYATDQLVMPTPGERSAWNEIDRKYEHEPINSQIGSAAPTAAAATTPTSPTDVSAPVATLPQAVNNDPALTSGLPPMIAYARMVQEKVSRTLAYPPEAESLGYEAVGGTVKLKLRILQNGSLDSAEVVNSSGSDILDHDAVKAAKKAAPFDPFMTGMPQGDIVLTIPIVYNKNHV
jgi:pilus assembly protein CpaC